MSSSSSSSNTPEPLDPNFQLKLPTFEGPLDLLLHLIQKHELEIVDLPISFVTEKYLDYIRVMERLDLDIASEYLVMAATLAHIKSKSLLPADPEAQHDDADPEEEIDPRQELIRRLLEYQKYKAAGEELGARGVQGRDVFLRGMEAPEASGPAPLAGIGLFKLLDAFQVVLKRTKVDLAMQVTSDGVSIQDRMTQLHEKLRLKRRCTFDELFEDVKTLYDVVVTFMAILEMAKRRLARVYQSEPIAPIHLEYRVLEADDVDDEAGAEAAYGAPMRPEREPAATKAEAVSTVSEPGEPAADVVEAATDEASDEASDEEAELEVVVAVGPLDAADPWWAAYASPMSEPEPTTGHAEPVADGPVQEPSADDSDPDLDLPDPVAHDPRPAAESEPEEHDETES